MQAFSHRDHVAYLKRLFLAVLGALSAVAGFNYLIDPYDVFGSPRRPGINQFKHGTRENSRIAKVYMVERVHPRTLILGSSRSEMALDPHHPALTRQPGFNLSVEGASYYENFRLLQHALAVAPVEEVYLNLDYFAAKQDRTTGRGFEEDRLAVQADGTPTKRRHSDLLQSLLSASALNQSWKTLTMQKRLPSYVIDGSGFREILDDNRDILAKGGHRRAFVESETTAATGTNYDPPQSSSAMPVAVAFQEPSTAWIRKILEACRERGVRLHLLIYPKHVNLQELIHAKGGWAYYQQWKRTLTALVASEANKPGWKQPPEIWDFSTLSSFNQEEVPADGDVSTQMRWYREPSHATKALGDMMLHRVNGTLPEMAFPPYFGVRLTAAIVDRELERQTEALELWRAAHRRESAEIGLILRRVPSAGNR